MEESSASLLVEGVSPLTVEEMIIYPLVMEESDMSRLPTEHIPGQSGGGYVLASVGKPKDVQLQYVYSSCVYEFC